MWQANSAGRYRHVVDQHPAPLDPNFSGAGRCITDDEGRYRFITIKPGAYPWRNHPNAWRAAHIHLSLFGPAFATRLVTQMYFPGDPLFFQDPIFQLGARRAAPRAADLGVRSRRAPSRSGRSPTASTSCCAGARPRRWRTEVSLSPRRRRPSAPSSTSGCPRRRGPSWSRPTTPARSASVGTVLDGEGEPVNDALLEIWQANRAGRYAHPEDTRDELPLEDGFDGLRPLRDRRRGALRVRDGQARPGPRPRRRACRRRTSTCRCSRAAS